MTLIFPFSPSATGEFTKSWWRTGNFSLFCQIFLQFIYVFKCLKQKSKKTNKQHKELFFLYMPKNFNPGNNETFSVVTYFPVNVHSTGELLMLNLRKQAKHNLFFSRLPLFTLKGKTWVQSLRKNRLKLLENVYSKFCSVLPDSVLQPKSHLKTPGPSKKPFYGCGP